MYRHLRKIFPLFPKNDGKEPKYLPVQQLQTGDLAFYVFSESNPDIRVYCQVITEREFIKAIHHRLVNEKNKDSYIYVDTVIGFDCLPSSGLTKITDIAAEIEAINRSGMSKQYKAYTILFLREAEEQRKTVHA